MNKLLTLDLKKVEMGSASFLHSPASSSHFDLVIDESTRVNLEGNKPIVYLNLKDQRLDMPLSQVKGLEFSPSTRKKLGDSNKSILVGAVSAAINRNTFCTVGAVSKHDPYLESLLNQDFSTVLDRLMVNYMPAWNSCSKSLLKKSGIHPDWQMAETGWTSAIINKNSQHNYHFDSSNLPNSYSAMIAYKNDVSGGYLVIPEYGAAFKMSNRSIIFFCGREILHGVSPIIYKNDGYRYSVVYYATNDIKKCGSYAEENLKAQK